MDAEIIKIVGKQEQIAATVNRQSEIIEEQGQMINSLIEAINQLSEAGEGGHQVAGFQVPNQEEQ